LNTIKQEIINIWKHGGGNSMERKIIKHIDKINEIIEGKTVYPITCEIDPSNLCNLDCSFCMYKSFIKEHKNLLDFNLFEMVIKQLKYLGVKSITFTGGGEPLMNKDFIKMASSAYSLGFEIGLITNGTLLKRIQKPEIFKFIRISLDAYDEDSYKKVKGKNLFTQVIRNIFDLVNSKPTDVGISYVICPDNISGIEEVQKIAGDLGVDYIQFKPAWINGKKTEIPEGLLEKEKSSIVTERFSAKDNLPCIIAGLIGIIGADANVYFCCQHRGKEEFSLGSLEENTFQELWEKRKTIIPEISKCPQCRYMNYARGFQKFSQSKYKFLRHTNFL